MVNVCKMLFFGYNSFTYIIDLSDFKVKWAL